MKIRNGFVSNSSSSSFVASAIPLTNELIKKLEEEYGTRDWYDLFFVPMEWTFQETEWIGDCLTYDEDMQDGATAFDEIKQRWIDDKDYQKLLQLAGKTPDDIKLIYGICVS